LPGWFAPAGFFFAKSLGLRHSGQAVLRHPFSGDIQSYDATEIIEGDSPMRRTGLRSSSRGWLSLLTVLLLAGCAVTPHDVHVGLTAEVPTPTVGNGTHLIFRFIDDRDDLVVGHRSAGAVGASITADELPKFVETELRDILQKKGYQIVASGSPGDPSVTYRLRLFKFEISHELFSDRQNSSVTIAVDATWGGFTYAQVYKANNEHGIFYVPDGGDLDGEMNGVLTKVLIQTASDNALDSFLLGH
jgi:uncharacterized lipoprotein